MTLIVAADIQDHLMLAGDHCAVFSRMSNEESPDVVVDHYRKIYPWKYGVSAASGDVFLMANFHRIFRIHQSLGLPIDVLHIARQAKAMRARSGVGAHRSTGNLFFTLPNAEGDGFGLFLVSIGERAIDCEAIEAISARFSMRKAVLDGPAYDDFASRLRPSFFFRDAEAFHRYHIGLLKRFFLRHSALDEWITASFDVCLLDKRTGVSMFWRVSDGAKDLAIASPL